MPLHDWTDLTGWDGVHHIWIVELLYWIKPRLPPGYRAYIGATPTLAIVAPPANPEAGPGTPSEEPDQEIAVASLASQPALLVERQGQLIAAVELVSPRNKDRPAACAAFARDYAAYLVKGVHLLLVDVHRRPLRFSFADQIAAELQMEQPPCPAPFAVSYRVGGPTPTGGRYVAFWRRQLGFGAPLPTLSLWLSVSESVPIDLDQTYARAAAAAYLS